MSNRNKNNYTNVTYTQFFTTLLDLGHFLSHLERCNITLDAAYANPLTFKRLIYIYRTWKKQHKGYYDFSDVAHTDNDYHILFKVFYKKMIHDEKEKKA